uniref:Tr-type G domain-containing protein n=1 Tax=Plectus sambesii TaxID=2011161 RepID=A0A914WW66_9BILA
MFCQRCSRLPGPADVFRLIRTTGIRHHSKLVKSSDPTKRADLSGFPPDKIRNFCIVAHVDHGKSTLADRLMELTGVVEPGGQKQQLDKLQVERERGITVKAQSCSMVHNGYLLNLIDTPGHVDFSFEVSRSLVACNGILLLVAANEGVQAQTVANFWLAFNQNLHMIPVINKVDLTPAKVDQVELQMKSLFEFDKEDCIRISAKSGLNVPAILSAIIDRIPPPKANRDAPFRALIFDSWFIQFRGAIACILVKEAVDSVSGVGRATAADASVNLLTSATTRKDSRRSTNQIRRNPVGFDGWCRPIDRLPGGGQARTNRGADGLFDAKSLAGHSPRPLDPH